MKKLTPLLAAVLVSSLFVFVSGCSETTTQEGIDAKANIARLQQAADEALADAKIAGQQLAWRKFKTDAELTISANDSTINHYMNMIAGTDSDRRAMYSKKIDALQLKNQRLKLRVAEYPDTTINSQAEFMREFSRDMNELAAALENFTVTN